MPLQKPDERATAVDDGWVGGQGSIYHRALAIPAVFDLLDPRRGEEILDIGAGQGVLALYLVRSGARYTGVDASPANAMPPRPPQSVPCRPTAVSLFGDSY